MDLQHFKQKLTAKEQECRAELAALEGDARGADDPDVGDAVDSATAEQGAAEGFEERSVVADTLEKVEDALRRVADGTYGKCLTCGKPIESSRLEAIPWAEYCLKDQERLEKSIPGAAEGATL